MGLNINDGKFTAPVTGMYEVSAAGACMITGPDFRHHADLMSDGEVTDLYFLFQHGTAFLNMSCSAFRYIYLRKDQTLYLKYHTNDKGSTIWKLKFCISLRAED